MLMSSANTHDNIKIKQRILQGVRNLDFRVGQNWKAALSAA